MCEILNTLPQKEECTYIDIIQEYLLSESRFIRNKDYVTSENKYIFCIMQMKV